MTKVAMRSFVVALLALVTTSACSGASSPTGPTTSEPKEVVEYFVSWDSISPAPLPDGRVSGYCGFPIRVPGVIRAKVFAHPGGTDIKMFLISRAIGTPYSCSPEQEVCPGAIGPVIFVDTITKEWSVEPIGEMVYCIMFRNRTETLQSISSGGQVDFIHR